ncbi:MAG: S4 domain-containing protein, partial [Ideonella sp.]
MATLKLKPKGSTPHAGGRADSAKPPRPPVRGVGAGVRTRPTLAQAQAMREEQERQPRERPGDRRADKPAPAPARRPVSARSGERAGPPPRPSEPRARTPRASSTRPQPAWQETGSSGRAESAAPSRRAPNSAFGARPERPGAVPAKFQPPPPARNAASETDATLRLSKYLSELGIASRREADEWIAKGWVRVDGRVVSELGSRVVRGQQVTVDAKARFVQAQKVSVLINKPVGYVSGQAEDGYEPAYVLVKP